MNANTARSMDSESRNTIKNPFSEETFHVIEGGASDRSTSKEFKPVNPFLEQKAENEALALRLRTLVADALAQHEDSWRQTPHPEVITGHESSQPLDYKEFGPKISKPFHETEAEAA